MIKAIIFDFDGVILESVNVKTDAFCQLFGQCRADQIEAVKQYHLDNGGISRVLKIRYAYEHILKEPLSRQRLDELCDQFHRIVVQQVVDSPFVRGAEELLEECCNKYAMFVVSGTPQDEMRDIVAQRGFQYFKGVYGSPTSKAEIIERILKDNGLKAGEAVFIGDSRNDLDAAKATGVYFIARYYDSGSDWLSDEHIMVKFKDMTGIFEHIESLNTGVKAGT